MPSSTSTMTIPPQTMESTLNQPNKTETSRELQSIFSVLSLNLEFCRNALKTGETKDELQRALHDDTALPDRKIFDAASKTINLLHEVEQLLEPGHLVLADHFLGYTNTKCLCAAVEMNVADTLAKKPLNLTDLATSVEARPDRLGQIMRALYSNGIFAYDEGTGLYSNNHTSTILRSDHWTQWHNWVHLYGNQFYDIARGIPASVQKDAVRWGAQINYDTDQDMFSYFQDRGWVPQLHKTLGGGAIAQAPGILEDYDWSDVAEKTVLDIGGGGGALVASLLRKHKTMRGAVFDLPKVIEHIRPFFLAGGQFEDLGSRVDQKDLVAGSFFEAVPAYEVYTMKWVLHDWKDDDVVKILENVRQAIVPGEKSRLVVLESILSDDRIGRLSRYGDINMMMTANGQERTEKQWREFAGKAGWRVAGIFDLRNAWVKAIELRP